MTEPMDKLGQFLHQLEKDLRVPDTDARNCRFKAGCEEIVGSLLHAIGQKDPRFASDFHGSGSYYDGVKVGEPDEFDFVAEMKELSMPGAVTMVMTSDPGFMQIEVQSMEVKKKWKDCLMHPHKLGTANANSMYHRLFGESRVEDELDKIVDLSNSKCILAPFMIQRLFKQYIDECMQSIPLPENWVHSGYQKPNYSGCRRHGPAAMLQFAYIVPDEEITINIDITIGIAVPLPTSAAKLNLYVFDNVKDNRMMHDKLLEIFSKGPQLHVIPLYSNVLIKTHRYQNKFAWRISCSLVETEILNCFPDNGPKLCLRILKAIRDKYLSEGKRKTRRRRKKKRQTKRSGNAASKPYGSVSSLVGAMPTAMKSNMDGVDEHQVKEHEHPKAAPKPGGSVGLSSSVGALPTSEENAEDVDEHQRNVDEPSKAAPKPDGNVGASSSVGAMPASEYTPRIKKNTDGMDKHQRKAGGSISSCSSMGVMPASEYTRRMKETQMTWMNIKAKYMELNKAEEYVSHEPERTVGPTSPIFVPPKDTTGGSSQSDRAYEDLSDATELEEKSKEEAFQEFRKTRIMFQRKDISDMVAEPGSGEYYGPKTYMSSIEIKTYVLRLIAGHADSEFWSPDNIVRHVNDFLRRYHTILLERKMMKNFFFDSMVCAPISEEQRLKALEKFNVLFEELNKVMEGGTPRLTYYAKGSHVIPFCFKQE